MQTQRYTHELSSSARFILDRIHKQETEGMVACGKIAKQGDRILEWWKDHNLVEVQNKNKSKENCKAKRPIVVEVTKENRTTHKKEPYTAQ